LAGAGANAVPGFNTSGRAYPDVAMPANNVAFVAGGEPNAFDGTSASAPIMAGVVSLVNAARLAEGKHAVGWLNPTLYTYGASANSFVANDIVAGNNSCQQGSFQTGSGLDAPCCAQG